jgi:hypothetical protein
MIIFKSKEFSEIGNSNYGMNIHGKEWMHEHVLNSNCSSQENKDKRRKSHTTVRGKCFL